MEQTRRELIIANAKDLVSGFLYYDRKEDEALGVGEIESAVIDGEITAEEIISIFCERLANALCDC